MEAPRKEARVPNPREKANFLSVLFFTWVLKIFRTDYKKKLELKDLWGPMDRDTSEHVGDLLEREWMKEVEMSKKSAKRKPPSLMWAITRAFKGQLVQHAAIHLIYQIIDTFLKPYLLGNFLSFFSVTKDNPVELKDIIYFGSSLILTVSITTLLFNHYSFRAWVVGMRIRSACVSLVYRKTLRIRSLGESSSGQIVNLVSNDVSRFDLVVFMLHYLWSAPIQTVAVGYFLYRDIGIPGLAGLVVICVVAPLQSYTAKLTSKYRYQTAFKTDERIRLTDEILSGIHVIKMFAWERPFIKFLEMIRALEVKVIRKTGFLRGFYMMFNLFTTRMALFCTLLTYTFSGNKLSGDKVFVVVAYFGMISLTMTSLFVRGLAEVAECTVSVERIQKFMMNEEAAGEEDSSDDIELPSKNLVVYAKDVNAAWNMSSSDPSLKGVNLQLRSGQVVGVIGAVGSGKTSLLNLLLKEVPIQSGHLIVNGSVSYASQDPWVFAGTVRQNILFGLPFESKRYKEVIKVCCLERDLELFTNADGTVIGDRGASLSGGQKARINLARAVYRKADLYLLDDPLSAVDTHVAKHLFQDCLRGFLRGKTVILATHQLQFAKSMDLIITLEQGEITAQGPFSEFSNAFFNKITPPTAPPGSETPTEAPPRDFERKFSISRTSLKAPSTTGEDEVSLNEDEPLPQEKEVEANVSYTGSTILGYIRASSSWFSWVIFTLLVFGAQFSASTCDIWVAHWTSHDEMSNSTSTEMDSYKIVYSVAIVTLLVTAFVRGIMFYVLCSKASLGLHSAMTRSIIGARMSFFHKNPSGGVLNRFSKDLGATDELFPKVLFDFSQGVGALLGATITCVLVTIWLLIPISGFALVTYIIRHFYIKTSKNLKRLENMSRSPVYSHLNTSLQGMSTIRAHKAQPYLRKEFDLHQDLNISSSYTFLGAQQAYAYLIDVVSFIYLAFVVMCFIIMRDESNPSSVGLAITQTMSVTVFLQWIMKQSSDLVTLMTSVERVLAFSKLPSEEPITSVKGFEVINLPGWPSEGRMEFRGMSLWYEPDEPPVISNLNLKIKGGEKIGIVGRTGAGKSSLIAAIFHLTDTEGQIFIDDIDTKTIGLETLRGRISIIPQDPVLFFGTIRRNLDPFNQYPDYVLWRALEDVEMRDMFGDGLGLDAKVQEGGSNLSVGQRQLICLARAIVKNNRIIVLDEATANVDPKTDALIQSAIKKKFRKCTVLTIAHRLHTVMESDRIVVMDAGLMVEFDAPHLLLQIKGGFLHSLVQETGASMASQLRATAEKHYWRMHQESLEE